MAGLRLRVITSTMFLFLYLISAAFGDEHPRSSSETAKKPSGFVLPQKPETQLTRSERHGKNIYEYYCSLCHGKTGNADGFNSFNLNPPPAKLADTNRMAARTDFQIQKIIREGGTTLNLSPLMPPWGGVLTDKEIIDLTAFVRTLARRSGHNVTGTK